jgi:SAM-dependent methyltransferase
VEVLRLNVLPGYYRAEAFPTPFDLVVLDNVLEHIEEPRAMLEDVMARVAPEGLLYLAVPANRGGLARLAFSLLWQRSRFSIFLDNQVHINHFTTAGIVRMATDCGAVIRKQLGPGRYLLGLPNAGGKP